MSDNAVYCSQCSQKYTTGKVPAWTFISEFFSQQLNIDSKLFRTLFALFIPGRLTNEYFKGKHKKFASPMRVFLVTAIILIATVSFMTGDVDFGGPNESDFVRYATKKEALLQLDSIKTKRTLAFNNPAVTKAYDSLYQDFQNQYVGKSRDSIELNRIFGDSSKKWVKMSKKEFANSSPKEIAEKYCPHSEFNWFDRIAIRQQAKIMKDSKNLFQFFLGKLTVDLLLMMPFLALILKMLYIRRDFYYVEHLIFSFHYHAFAFLTISVIVLVGKYLSGWIAVPIVGVFVYQFIAMKNVYQQGFFKTFLKFWVLFFLYLFLAAIFFGLAILASVILF